MDDKVYFCILSSWYHFLGASSYFEALEGQARKLVVLVEVFFDNKISINPEKLWKYTGELIFVNTLDEAVLTLNKEAFVTVVSPFEMPFYASRALRRFGIDHDFVVIEEGIGAYGGKLKTAKAAVRESIAANDRLAWFSFFIFGFKFTFKWFYFLAFKKIYWFNFDRSGRVLDERVRRSYVKAFSWIALEGGAELSFKGREVFLFVTSPFLELKLCEFDEYMSVVDKVISQASEGEVVVIKPHPIERVNKYASGLKLNPNIPLEMVLFQLPKESVRVFSFVSTSIYTAYILFGIKTHRISSFDLSFGGLSAPQQRIIEQCSLPETFD